MAFDGEAYFNQLMEYGDDLEEMSILGHEDDEVDQQDVESASVDKEKTNAKLPGRRKQNRDPVGTEVG